MFRIYVSLLLLLAGAGRAAAAEAAADFAAFDRRARDGERLNVVFLGGSLTWGAQATDPQLTSYRALVSRRLEDRYPAARFRFWDAAIGGTGSELGAFRLERDVLARSPDLVFLDFTVNDGPHERPRPDRLAAYESLVRRMVRAGAPVVQAIFAVKRDVAPEPPARLLDSAHKAVARAYGLPVGDAVELMRAKVASGEADPDALWPVETDAVHPGDAGYALYAEAVWSAFDIAVKERRVCRAPDRMLHAETYMTVRRARVATLVPLPAGWRAGAPHREAVAFDFIMSRWADDMGVAEGAAAAPLRLRVRGENVLLFGEGTPISGRYEVRIDGGVPSIYDPGAPARNGNFRHVQMIARGLSADREHLIEIRPLLADGRELRIESVCVAGSPATVEVVSDLRARDDQDLKAAPAW